MSILAVEGIGIDFGGVTAVDKLDFSTDEGQILSIIGPNGAGKTTLFNIISGIYMPNRGKVTLAGKDATGLAPYKLARLGLSRTFQNLQIFSKMTALENVMSGCHLAEQPNILADMFNLPASRKKTAKSRERAAHLLKRVGLAEVSHSLASDLSYGSLKRLEIARALACNPRILLLDEPAAGCNAVETQEIDILIADIAKSGVSVLLVEHDMKLVMKISDHIIVLNYGQKLAQGTPMEVKQNPKVIEAYLGIQGQKEAARAFD